MKLEKEIMLTQFRNEFHKVAVNVKYSGNWLNVNTASLLKPYGITNQQYNILRILRGKSPEPATINLLIERMLDKSSNASRIVDKLISKNLVERRINSNDRRSVDVLITNEGLKLLSVLDPLLVDFEKNIRESLTEKEAHELNRLLDKLRG